MRQSRVRFSGREASCHTHSSADCITTTSESEFSHTGRLHPAELPTTCSAESNSY